MTMSKYTERQNELIRYRKERRRKKAKAVLTIFLCAVVSAGIVGTLFFAPFFNVVEVYSVGNERLDENYIIAASNIRIGDNIFRTGLDSIISDVTAIPYVREANARRVFPNRIRIWVRENEPKANIAIEDLFVAIDERGNVLEFLQEPYRIPTIRGLNVDKASPGERLTAHNSLNMEIALTLINSIISNDISDSIISVDVANLTRISMNYENRINVIMGDANNLAYKVMFMQAIIESEIAPHEQGILDMSLEEPHFSPRFPTTN